MEIVYHQLSNFVEINFIVNFEVKIKTLILITIDFHSTGYLINEKLDNSAFIYYNHVLIIFLQKENTEKVSRNVKTIEKVNVG